MSTISLTAQARPEGKPKVIRREGQVPCVLYGNDTANVSLVCNAGELFRVYVKAGESTIVELDAAGKKVPVLFHSVDFHPVTDAITHVDFYAVDMKKEIEAQVPVHFVGVAPAVKDLGGVMVTSLDHVTVKCLPADLPSSLDANIEKLKTFDDSLTVADIDVSDKVAIQQDAETVLATVQAPRREVEKAAEEGEEGATEGGEGEAKSEDGGSEAKSE